MLLFVCLNELFIENFERYQLCIVYNLYLKKLLSADEVSTVLDELGCSDACIMYYFAKYLNPCNLTEFSSWSS